MNQNLIDQLWDEIEESTWPLSNIAPLGRKLGYYTIEDDQYASPEHIETFLNNPENNYWMRNATFALLILAAEGEL